MKLINTYLTDFIALIFPELCAACNKTLLKGEDVLCTNCHYNLPYTNFHLQADNIVAKQFWGKLPIAGAYALFYFAKGGNVQNLVHRLKYDGRQNVGVLAGHIAGTQLHGNAIFSSVDVIIPVPLHKSKLRKRGFNQSACFAKGISDKINATVAEDNLIRVVATDTQTKKGRFGRFENMQQVFAIMNPEKLAGKHVLLVDDIITTGSTLEACATELLKIQGVKVSIATIAYAE